jgi:DNA-binding transcriptional ArsR family regulator
MKDKEEIEYMLKEFLTPRFSNTVYHNPSDTQNLTLRYPKASVILQFLASKMDNNNIATCSYKEIQSIIKSGQSTVTKYLTILREEGYISVSKNGNKNVYTIKKGYKKNFNEDEIRKELGLNDKSKY